MLPSSWSTKQLKYTRGCDRPGAGRHLIIRCLSLFLKAVYIQMHFANSGVSCIDLPQPASKRYTRSQRFLDLTSTFFSPSTNAYLSLLCISLGHCQQAAVVASVSIYIMQEMYKIMENSLLARFAERQTCCSQVWRAAVDTADG